MREPTRVEWRRRKSFLATTLIVFLTTSTVLIVLSGVGFGIARKANPVLTFFDPRRAPTIDEAWTACVMDYALESTEANDVIFLGDSICRSGIEPVQFENLTRLRAYNLGVLFGGLGADVIPTVAESYLLRHPAPRMIVLCASPVCFEKEVDAAFVQLRDRFLNCFAHEAPNLRSLDGRLSYLMSVSYLMKQGTVIGWDRTFSSLTGRVHDVRDDSLEREEGQTYRALEVRTRKSRGFYPMVSSGRKGFLDRTGRIVRIHDAWNRGVRRLAEDCEEAHVPLMIRLGPISAGASKNLNFEDVERWLKDLQVSYPHLVITRDNIVLRYPIHLCSDSMHLNVYGAAKFTTLVAAEVTQALGITENAKGK